jgi:D-sedoheptulose 7-phosphate isomerase
MALASERHHSQRRARAHEVIARAMARRSEVGMLMARDAVRVASACHAMAARFHRGGKLIVFGEGSAASDAQHVAVEFVHPVIVGKRALPAITLGHDAALREEFLAHQVRCLATPDDIAVGFLPDDQSDAVLRALEVAHQLGLLTVALVGRDGSALASSPAVDFAFAAASDDPTIVKEIEVTTYHILWELVHVFFEHPGILQPGFIK